MGDRDGSPSPIRRGYNGVHDPTLDDFPDLHNLDPDLYLYDLLVYDVL